MATTRKGTKAAAKPAAEAEGSTRRKVQLVAMIDPEISEALDAYATAHKVSRSEAARVFLGYGRTAAERWANAPQAKARPPARAPRGAALKAAS